MVDNKVYNEGKVEDLTLCEKEILNLLAEERLTPKQIALRRECTRQAVSKILKSLKKKGVYTISLHKVDKEGGTCQPPNQIRIHAQQYIIKIIWKDNKYKEILNNSNQLQIDGNTLDLHENSIYISMNQSFYGDNLPHAFWKCAQYWPRFLARCEHELKCLLFKPRAQNIKLVRVHIAETNNELAKQIDNTCDKYFKVYAEDDGKLRFLVDNSFNLHEFEAVRSTSARPDMEKIGKVFNDLADKEHYLPSDTRDFIEGIVKATANLTISSTKIDEKVTQTLQLLEIQTKATTSLARNIESHIPSWMSNVKVEKELKKLRRIMNERQQKLDKFL